MRNELTVFENEKFGKVRVVTENEKPYFNLNDVCEILGLKNPRQVKTRLKEDGVRLMDIIDNLGRVQKNNFIDESNLYKCIFQSDKPEAEAITEWVTGEVLPAIRKTGMYATEELLNNPDLAIQAFMKLKEEMVKRKELEKKVEEQQSKVDFYNDVTGSDTTAEIATVAKVLNFKNIGRNTLFNILRNQGILQKDNVPFQTYVDRGYFRVVESKWNTPNGDVKVNYKTVVYQKGIEYISKILRNLGYEKAEEVLS